MMVLHFFLEKDASKPCVDHKTFYLIGILLYSRGKALSLMAQHSSKMMSHTVADSKCVLVMFDVVEFGQHLQAIL